MGEDNPQRDEGLILPVPHFKQSDTKWLVPFGVVSLSRIFAQIHPSLDTRNILPEPVDLPNHVGNAAVTFVLLERVANGYWGKEPEVATPQQFEASRKRFAVAIGVLTVISNVVAEKVGYGPTSTPDLLDFVYGCIGGALAYKAKRPDYLSPSDVNLYRQQGEYEEAVVDELFAHAQGAKSTVETTARKSTPQHQPKKQMTAKRPSSSRSKRKMQRSSRKKNRK
jgi:hypothetical protein